MVALYLASTSPARRKILSDIGLTATILSPDVDEEDVVATMPTPHSAERIALTLARMKAESVVGPDIDGLIIGGDSVFALGEELHGKPLTADVALSRWHMMRGHTGELVSGLWVIDHTGGALRGSVGETSSARISFSEDLTDEAIKAYVATGEPLNVAGAFTLDSLGAAFIDSVEGDPYAVVGMSARSLRRLIESLGHSYTDLWAASN